MRRFKVTYPSLDVIELVMFANGKLCAIDSEPRHGGFVVLFQSIQEAVDYGCKVEEIVE